MIRSIRAELVKLTRPRFLAITAILTTLFSAAVTAAVVLTAEPAATGSRDGPELLSIEALSGEGGGTAVFAQVASFGAVVLLAVFVATVAGELSRGTFRTMLLQQPGRARVLIGKMVAVVGFTVVLTLFAEAVAWLTARLLAPGQGIETSQWMTGDALVAAVEDNGRLLAFIVGWAVIATMVGVLARSVPIGVGVGLIWAGPIENIIGDGWTPGQQFFPGLVLRALINPENAEISTGRALATVAVYAAVAVTIAGIALRGRDVTS